MVASSSSKPTFADGAEKAKAVILSLSGTELGEDERSFFKQANPLGFILFARNCETPDQLRKLTDDLKETLGRDCPILIDQEGGRVQRMGAPRWRVHPPMKGFGDLAAMDMDAALGDLRFTILQIAEELQDSGINANCAPVLDILLEETHEVIGDRAFSDNPDIVSRLGVSVCRNLLKHGVTPIIKHIPGHGRATLDSHKDLPVVDASLADLEDLDFLPFQRISESPEAPAIWAMTAHIVYPQLDPDHPATMSKTILKDVIRDNIGFEGFLISDDVDMRALDGYGEIHQRVLQTLDAGVDTALYCWAKMDVMEQIADTAPVLSEKARKRLQKSADFRKMAA